MSSPPDSSLFLNIGTDPVLFAGAAATIRVGRNVTVLVGPNGVGKTRTLRKLQTGLSQLVNPLGKHVRFLAAGRSSPLERFRALIDYPHNAYGEEPAHLGNASYRQHWHQYEAVTGDYLALEQRADLRLKVQARLQTFLGRSLSLRWSQNGLEISLSPVIGGESYRANAEASGILQLVALLTSIYHDEIGALLIDEPEISLHPQYQAFIRDELTAVSGDPREDSSKKFVVIGTHSPAMLGIRQISDLPNLVSFASAKVVPSQLPMDAPQLKNKRLSALVSRLTATHRLAFFAQNVLLVEGPSDETILEMLALSLQHPLMPTNTQIVPVSGKGEFIEAVKLFELLGKRVTILADLDGLADANALVSHFGMLESARSAAAKTGHASATAFDRSLRSDFAKAVSVHWEAIEPIVTQERYWFDCTPEKRDDAVKRRGALSALLGGQLERLTKSAPSAGFQELFDRFCALLAILGEAGAFFLRRGTIEAYFQEPTAGLSKPDAAALEAASFSSINAGILRERYHEAIAAMTYAGQITVVDENTMLRERLGAILGAAFQTLSESTTNEALNARARVILGEDATIFELENASTPENLRLRVNLTSTLFVRSTFPFEISATENPTAVVAARLPSQAVHGK